MYNIHQQAMSQRNASIPVSTRDMTFEQSKASKIQNLYLPRDLSILAAKRSSLLEQQTPLSKRARNAMPDTISHLFWS
jgi:hypothetical protein